MQRAFVSMARMHSELMPNQRSVPSNSMQHDLTSEMAKLSFCSKYKHTNEETMNALAQIALATFF